jgi:hypothetical protein
MRVVGLLAHDEMVRVVIQARFVTVDDRNEVFADGWKIATIIIPPTAMVIMATAIIEITTVAVIVAGVIIVLLQIVIMRIRTTTTMVIGSILTKTMMAMIIVFTLK